MSKTYFPLRILETESRKIYTVNSPEEIPNGVSFTVLETNVTVLETNVKD